MEIPAEHVQALNIESQPNQESRHENPIEKNRRPTNRWFVFIVFIPILVLWITTCISGFFANYDSHDRETFNTYYEYINAPITKISSQLPITLFSCIAVIYICLFTGEKLTKICVYTSSVVMILYAISCCLEAVQFMLGKSTKIHDSIAREIKIINNDITMVLPVVALYVLIYVLPNFINTITGIISFFIVDKSILCDITNYSCRSILRSISSLLFTALITISKFLLFSLTLNAIIYDWFSNRGNTGGVLATFILIGGLSMINVINNYARIVISEYTIQSCWTKDEKISIVPIATKVFRNHIGTAMFASTMILSFFTSILQAFKHKPSWRIKENCMLYIVTKFALVTTPDTALIFTSIYGTSFLKSYQKAFDTVLRRSTTYMAMLTVLDGLFSIMYLALTVPVWIIVISAGGADHGPITPDLCIIFYGFFYSYLTFELLITSTMKAQLINKIIILNKEDHDAEETNLNQNNPDNQLQ